ncbi:MAG: haloacid dehalogenase type II [Acidobacteriia bacterium]|nr:haloacid dehalogenase type II [Terriglobia bacterium]MYG03751.1 haloacid dehalogenase type II [Terriglobia bacterium]MYK11979.1 haloacid dehalogenase type II [Terriglobia bacterium]
MFCAAGAPLLQAFQPDSIKALAFDVFGTVVDWRSTVIREGRALGKAKGLNVDWAAFADAWRDGYGPAMNRVRNGELQWKTIDELHRLILDGLLERFAITGLDEAEKDRLNRVWHRLDPWPDAVEGLTKLKSRFIIASLSNGNVALLVNMAKHGGLPWDAVLSAELAGRYKPDREVYLKAADLLGLEPAAVMMVAAHKGDLRAAARAGLRTAFVPRPRERPNRQIDLSVDGEFDVSATDFVDLASKLGA